MKAQGHSIASVVGLLVFGMAATVHSAGLRLEQHLLPAGGGGGAGGTMTLAGSIGIPVAGTFAASPTDSVRAGFWFQAAPWVSTPPFAGTDLLERRPGESVTVLRRILLANDHSVDWLPLQWVSAGPLTAQGGSVFMDGPWVIYQPHPTLPANADDVFTYRVREPGGAESVGTVLVRVASPPGEGAPNALEIGPSPGNPGDIRVRFQGIPFRTYRVEAASDPAGPWTDLGAVAASANGVILFEEPAGLDPRFFRLVEPAPPVIPP